MKGKHEFVVTTFIKPTYCDCCSRLLWGLTRQGLQCSYCEANIHKSCQHLLLVSCHGPANPKKDLLKELEKEKTLEFKDFKEPLNLLTTTPKNFTRLVSRLGPIVNAQEEILAILEWNQPGKSSAYLLGFILFCLYPWIIVFAPTIYLGYHILRDTGDSTDKYDTQTQYMKNMQFIQNHMKVGSDLFDLINEKHQLLKESASQILLSTFGISITLALALYYNPIPLNWIFLLGGVPMFIRHTVTFRYCTLLFKRMFKRSLEYYKKNQSPPLYINGENDKSIKIFENQRWWAGLGWIPFLLKNERSAWSDQAGTIAYSHIHDYVPPDSNWVWKENEWTIFEDWSKDGVDGQGWVYYDNSWQGPHPRITLGSYTRRRCWIRTMECVDGKLKQC